MTPTLRDDFLRGMSTAAATVNIISTDGPAGRAGVTVSAMTSVSADTAKPTLLTCVHHLSPAAQKIIDNGCFIVNVLRDDQSYISDSFAGRFKDQLADKFDCCAWAVMETGAPRVVDPLVAFDCRVTSSERVGTHHVIFGEVQGVYLAPHGSPLIYAHRSYGNHNRIEGAASISAGRAAPVNRLSLGCIQSLGPMILPDLLQSLLAQDAGLDVTLIEGDQRRLQEALRAGEVEAALLYDQNLPDDLAVVPVIDLHPQVLLPQGHALGAKARIDPADLAGLPMILMTASPAADLGLRQMRDAGVDPKIALRSASLETVQGFVARGLGYGLLASPLDAQVQGYGACITRPLAAPSLALGVVMATLKSAGLTPTATRLLALCQDRLAPKA
jgi:flavin reductase (DIM6/NTAB) family NADH-FMN oxidoreductase RutF